jgi:hypothetical protein
MPEHDEMAGLARRHGKAVFHRFEEVPGCAGMEE